MAEKRRGASEAAAAFDTFVGYTRVSTGKQAENGPSLQAQQDRMLAWIADHGSKLLGIYQDVGSAYTPSAEREELTDAIRDARANNVPMLVPSVDRLSRNLDVLPRLDGIEVVSLDEGWVTSKQLRSLVQAASQESEVRSEASKADHERRKKTGKKRPAPAHLPAIQPRGTRGNMTGGNVVIENLMRAFDAHPELDALTHEKRAERLNALGIPHRKKRKKKSGGPWSGRSMEYYWPKVKREIAVRAELEEDPTGFDPSGAPD